MKTVTLTIPQEQAEIILTSLLDLPFKQVNQLIHYIAKEIEVSQYPKVPASTAAVTTPRWGYKKDGTAKKAPGRPVKKAVTKD